MIKEAVARKPKFILRDNLGKLVKFLRLLGYDAVLYPKISFHNVLRIAAKDRRIILTRSPKEAKQVSKYKIILIKSVYYEEQLKELRGIIDFKEEFFAIRCSLCNRALEPAQLDFVKKKVPEYVFRHNTDFLICKKCGRIYWKGSHFNDIEKKLADIL